MIIVVCFLFVDSHSLYFMAWSVCLSVCQDDKEPPVHKDSSVRQPANGAREESHPMIPQKEVIKEHVSGV